jgi:glycosyltransferase involved in cell wall biosynthesis
MLLEAAASASAFEVVVVGEGPDRARLEELAHSLDLDGRVRFTGQVDGDELAALYARCLAVFYAPVDEDFGFVPYEAFLSEKPVVTTRDAGGPLEVVTDRKNGVVAEACAWLAAHHDAAREQGRAGKELAARLSWETTIERLLAP